MFRIIGRALRIAFLATLSIATIAFVAGWILSFSRTSWTWNDQGFSKGLYTRDDEAWRILAMLDRGWLHTNYRGHSRPHWPDDWKCGGLLAEPFDGLGRATTCPHVTRSGLSLPYGDQWVTRGSTEDEVADWVVCRNQGDSTEVFNVTSNEEWLRVRSTPDVWHSPGAMRKHIDFWLAIPFWALTMMTGTIPFIYFVRWTVRYRLRRTADGVRCSKCGYNLTGNVSGTCPECGSPAKNPT